MKLSPREAVIFAEDFEAMIEWYQSALGFSVSRLFQGDYNFCNLENEVGIQLGIAEANQMGVSPTSRANNTVVLQFEVDDVRQFFEHLQKHGGGITFGPSFDEKDQFWFGGFEDLEGNPFWVVDKNCP